MTQTHTASNQLRQWNIPESSMASCQYNMECPVFAGGEDGLQIWGWMHCISSQGHMTKGDPKLWGTGRGQQPHIKNNYHVMKNWWWSCHWGETMSLNCGHKRAYCSSPRWYMSMEAHDGMTSTGDNSWVTEWHRQRTTPESSTTTLWQSWQKRHLAANQEELGEGNYEFWPSKISLFILRSNFFTYRKMLWHGTPTVLLLLRRKACCKFYSP
jgi:hypothetical protein